MPVEFRAVRLKIASKPPEGLEAAARIARYRALGQMAREAGCDVVLLAHHRQDQAETFLLQALRGAGVTGLAGMPTHVERDGIAWVRPWLGRDRAEIEAYVRRHRLKYVDDDSNSDARFARNRLRLQVWPALAEAFPQAAVALSDSARWAADASACLAELAAHDLHAHGAPGKGAASALPVAALTGLSEARARNLLRHWLRDRLHKPAPASVIERVWAELGGRKTAQWELPAGVRLRLYRGLLQVSALGAPPPRCAPEPLEPPAATLSLPKAGLYRAPGWGGSLELRRVASGGVPLESIETVELRQREGGEQFQRAPATPARSLKKQYQLAAVPAWDRGGPLVYAGGRLVYVPGLGLDARALAMPGKPRVELRWIPEGAADRGASRLC